MAIYWARIRVALPVNLDSILLAVRMACLARADGHVWSLRSLARDWRTDKYLRRLEATMVVTDGDNAYLISGGGDVMNAEMSTATNVRVTRLLFTHRTLT
jgi:hypothetical protein